ncbi:MAG: Holliday junction branch migration protein RuvA [Deltaproteobacteria bacterium]|nr:MAG: Holliday junction branch migration protein RuvA [Deltaproteobacteria bacterium]
MIALLRGDLAYKSIDHVIVDTGGVGYRVFIPLSTFYALPDTGAVRLLIHTHVREDALLLFGFATPAEKDMFAQLIGISGIGPKVALNILSHIPVAELQTAVLAGDIKRLSALPGIGKKTAERLVLELKDKLGPAGLPTAGQPPAAQPTARGQADPLADVLSALVNLGYKDAQARKVLESMEIAHDAPMEAILKGALKVLAR